MAEQEFKAAFQQFQWHLEGADKVSIPSDAAIRLASRVRDMASGISTILELVEHDLILGNDKLLTPFQIGSLLRLSVAATIELDGCAESFTQWVEKHHMQEARHA